MQINIRIGDVVMLKSGGQKMTVNDISFKDKEVDDILIECVWFDNNNELNCSNFAYNSIILVI
jgi:uncharacterized protein YodC (DUF2158 family)